MCSLRKEVNRWDPSHSWTRLSVGQHGHKQRTGGGRGDNVHREDKISPNPRAQNQGKDHTASVMMGYNSRWDLMSISNILEKLIIHRVTGSNSAITSQGYC